MNCVEWRFATKVRVQFQVDYSAFIDKIPYFSISGTQISEPMLPITDRQKMFRAINCGLELAPDEFGTGGFLIRKSTGCDRFEFTQQAIFTDAGQLTVTFFAGGTNQASIVGGLGIPLLGSKFLSSFNFSPWIPTDRFYGYGFKAVPQGQFVSIGQSTSGDASYACGGTFSEFKNGEVCQLQNVVPIPGMTGVGTATLSLLWS